MASKPATTPKPRKTAKALMLFFKLNADAMNYTPLSHRGKRAARLMPAISSITDSIDVAPPTV